MRQQRLLILAGLGMSIWLVLGQIWMTPLPEQMGSTPLPNFPSDIPLVGGQSEPFSDPSTSLLNLGSETLPKADQLYRYRYNGLPLEIEMRYLENNHLEKYLQAAIPDANLDLRHQPETGHYALLIYQQRTFLHSCIPLWGGKSTVTWRQYRREQDSSGIQWRRVIPWLRGQMPLRSRGCVWAQLSIPIDPNAPGQSEELLETIWPDWYRWWADYLLWL